MKVIISIVVVVVVFFYSGGLNPESLRQCTLTHYLFASSLSSSVSSIQYKLSIPSHASIREV